MTLLVVKKEESHRIDTPKGARSATALGDLPRLTTTVPREYVHRASLAEVFLTSCEKIDDTRFSLTAQLPRAHTFFNSSDGRRHDPTQIGETLRQVTLFLGHSDFGVPLGYHFVLWELTFAVHTEQLIIGSAPTDLTLDVVCTNLVKRGSKVSEFTLEATVWRDGQLAATGSTRTTCVSDTTYRRLRGSSSAGALSTDHDRNSAYVDPSAFGRVLYRDVVLDPTNAPNQWLLNPDPRHPILFDHGGDHIPGMVLVEAARQAAYGLLAPGFSLTPTSMSTDFFRYVEFESPCSIEATPLPVQQSGVLSVHVTGHQNNQQVFASQVSGTLSAP
ncbi:ScbA/BarX family gamma-butyrolactone biosynthesis protein [Streptomyces sp. NPDC059009]|uniref:ScbA/BarX family gamma-butyrolactone biosynthesis protein n=1 Tax=Streptomyces sp. NPDC059009 TaxID=3346694 RepID=UPI0036781C3B